MVFIAISPLGESIISKYQKAIYCGSQNFIILDKKLNLTNLDFILITSDPPNFTKTTVEDNIQSLNELYLDWGIINGAGVTDIRRQEQAWSRIDTVCDRLPGHIRRSNPKIRILRNCKKQNTFILFLTGNEPNIFPTYELNVLGNLWQLENGFIPIHSGGVVHRDKLFIFGGPSGAGKSTVSEFSIANGDWVLDEDQLLLKPQSDKSYYAQAWGYSLQNSEIPLNAVFKLIKDSNDSLIPLSRSQTARFLIERSMDVMGYMIEKKHIEMIFHHATELSRYVPGYELHFRKSLDFWKVIDAEFGLD